MTKETVSDGSGRPKYVAWRSCYLEEWPQAMTHGKQGAGGPPDLCMCETVATSETVSDGSERPRYVACEVARDVKGDLTRTGQGRPPGSPAGGVPIGMTTDLADLAGCLWQRTDNCTRKGEHGSRVDTGCDLA